MNYLPNDFRDFLCVSTVFESLRLIMLLGLFGAVIVLLNKCPLEVA